MNELSAEEFCAIIPTQLDKMIPMLSLNPALLAHMQALIDNARSVALVNKSIVTLHLRRLEFYLAGRKDFVRSKAFLAEIAAMVDALPSIRQDILYARINIMRAAFARWKEHDYHKSIGLLKGVSHLVIGKDGCNEEELMIYNGLGQSYSFMGDLENAEIYVTKGAEVVARTQGFLGNKDAFYQILVRIYLDRNQLDKAEEYIKHGLKYNKSIITENARPGSLGVELTYSEVLVKLGRNMEAYEQTKCLLKNARWCFKEEQDPIIGRILMWQAYAALNLGGIAEARTLMDESKAIEEYSKDKPSRYTATFYFVLGELCAAEGNLVAAQNSYKKAEVIYNSIFDGKQISDIQLLCRRLSIFE